MANLPRQTFVEYYRRIKADQISRGFQPANPVTFDIKNYVLHVLKDNLFNGQAINDSQEHLSKFYETCSMCKPPGVEVEIVDDQVKLRFFGFSLIGRANDCLLCIPNRKIQPWKEPEDKFLE